MKVGRNGRSCFALNPFLLSPNPNPQLPYDEAKLVDSHCITLMKEEFPTLGLVLDLQVKGEIVVRLNRNVS